MVHQTVDIQGRVRLYAPKSYWKCDECGSPAGYIYHNVHIKMERHSFCKTCDGKTTQHAEKNNV